MTVLKKKVVDVPTMKYQSINLSKKEFRKSVFKCENSEKQFHHFEERKSSSDRSTTLPSLQLGVPRNYYAGHSTTTVKDYYTQKDSKKAVKNIESENLSVFRFTCKKLNKSEKSEKQSNYFEEKQIVSEKSLNVNVGPPILVGTDRSVVARPIG